MSSQVPNAGQSKKSSDNRPGSSVPSSPSKSSSRLWRRSLKDYVTQELTRGYMLELEEERYAARREKVYTFLSVPCALEKLMGYGFLQCLDAFLFLFTFLPLRGLLGMLRLILKIFENIIKFQLPFRRLRGFLKPAEKCDLMKLIIFVLCVYVYSYVDTSVCYHIIKSQSVIKLYIGFNMLEVGDRLMASLVQDTLDALFFTATEKSDKRSRWGVTTHLLLAVVCVFLHAFVLLLQGTVLSVAINSSNRALLTVMMSNNFVELKGAVFKKFDKINLFQVSCSDIRERFHLCVLLLIVCIQTMREYSWEESRFWVLFPDCLMVLLAEIIVDWLKHAFITRFNEIPDHIYREYTLSLAYDLAQTKQRRAFSDHSDMIGRRLGFVPLPLAVVLARVVRPSLKGPFLATTLLAVLLYIALSSFRLLVSINLLGKACNLIDEHRKESSPQHTVTQQAPASCDPKVSPTSVSNAAVVEDLVSKFKTSSQPTTRSPSPSRINNGSITQRQLKDCSNQMHNTNDENSPFSSNFDFVPPKSKFSPKSMKKSFYNALNRGRVKGEKKTVFSRSISASHTPRPSIAGQAGYENYSPSFGEAPLLPDASTALLMANSTVSILSVNLNEEMLRAAVNGIVPSDSNSQPEPLNSASSLHSLPGEIQNSGPDDSNSNLNTSISSHSSHSRKHSLGSSSTFEF